MPTPANTIPGPRRAPDPPPRPAAAGFWRRAALCERWLARAVLWNFFLTGAVVWLCGMTGPGREAWTVVLVVSAAGLACSNRA